MGVKNDFSISLVGNMAKFMENFMICPFFLGSRLRQERKILFNANLSSIEKFFHNTHKLNKSTTYDL